MSGILISSAWLVLALAACWLAYSRYREIQAAVDAAESRRLTEGIDAIRDAGVAQTYDRGTEETLSRFASATGRPGPYRGRHRRDDQPFQLA